MPAESKPDRDLKLPWTSEEVDHCWTDISNSEGTVIAMVDNSLAPLFLAAGELLAFAECHEAQQRYAGGDLTHEAAKAVFKRHGYGAEGFVNYLSRLRDAALAKVKGAAS